MEVSEEELAELREELKVGLDQLEAGQGEEWDLEETKARLREPARRSSAMPEDSPRYLFVYGTLLPGLAPPAIADVVNTLRVIGPATVPGRLYHLGGYPGCVLDGECDGVIHGQLLEIPDPAVLGRLDWYEGYAAHDDAGSLFLRTVCDVTLEQGGQVRSWVYVYNRPVSPARLISSGRYHPDPT